MLQFTPPPPPLLDLYYNLNENDDDARHPPRRFQLGKRMDHPLRSSVRGGGGVDDDVGGK